MTFYEIPLQAQNQTLSVSLNGTLYHLRVYWCDPVSCWMLDIDDASSNPIVNGQALITGANILNQLEYLNVGVLIILSDGADPLAMPTFDNLGTDSNLYFVIS